jgi:hypothetical protein
MSKLLKEANEREAKKNVLTIKDYNLPFEEFVIKCRINCDHSKYGAAFPKKILHDDKRMKEISPTLDKGDCHINYKKYFETKISYASKKGRYSINNIRAWQKFDYFVFCFVDTNDNYKPHFYCLPKKVITENPCIHLTGMNNNAEINSKNKYVGMKATIKHDDLEWLFEEHNVLKGTEYKHLQSFINKINKKTKK